MGRRSPSGTCFIFFLLLTCSLEVLSKRAFGCEREKACV